MNIFVALKRAFCFYSCHPTVCGVRVQTFVAVCSLARASCASRTYIHDTRSTGRCVPMCMYAQYDDTNTINTHHSQQDTRTSALGLTLYTDTRRR